VDRPAERRCNLSPTRSLPHSLHLSLGRLRDLLGMGCSRLPEIPSEDRYGLDPLVHDPVGDSLRVRWSIFDWGPVHLRVMTQEESLLFPNRKAAPDSRRGSQSVVHFRSPHSGHFSRKVDAPRRLGHLAVRYAPTDFESWVLGLVRLRWQAFLSCYRRGRASINHAFQLTGSPRK
jgi:hypothetical protein